MLKRNFLRSVSLAFLGLVGISSLSYSQLEPYQGEENLKSFVLIGQPYKGGKAMKKSVVLEVQEFNENGDRVFFGDYRQEVVVELRANSGSQLAFMLPQDTVMSYKVKRRYSLDSKGNPVEVLASNARGGTGKVLQEFDAKGRKIKMTGYAPNGKPRYVTTFAYTDKGELIIEKSETTKGDLRYVIRNTYDENGNIVESVKMGYEDRFLNHFKYEYDSNGNLVLETSLNEEGGKISEQEYVYNEDNLLTKHTHTFFKPDGNKAYDTRYEYTYDDNGRRETETYFNRRGAKHSVNRYFYNKNDQLVKQEFQDSAGNVWETTEFEYLKDGSIKEKRVFNAKGELIDTYQYQYTFY